MKKLASKVIKNVTTIKGGEENGGGKSLDHMGNFNFKVEIS